MSLNRRAFFKTGAAGFGSLLLMPSCLKQSGPYRFFTRAEADCVIAICEQIIPADEYGGGATEAEVIHYIDRQLVAVFDYDQLIYQKGLEALQQTCLGQHGGRFESLESGVQLQILQAMESNNMPEKYHEEYWGELEPSRFFNLLIDHCMQGFYGAPRHGGNRSYMSYKMMGLDFPLVVGRNHYEHLI